MTTPVRQPPTEVFAALGEPTRQRLLEILADQESAAVAALTGPLGISRQAVEKHLRVLLAADLVRTQRRGRNVSYAVQPTTLRESADWLAERSRAWDRQLALVKRAAEARTS